MPDTSAHMPPSFDPQSIEDWGPQGGIPPSSPTVIAPKPYWSWLFKRLGFDWEDDSWDGWYRCWKGHFRLFGWILRIESPSRVTTVRKEQS